MNSLEQKILTGMFQTESLLLIRPLIEVLTRSEIHAIMTAGFATVAGAFTAAYVMLGVSSSDVINFLLSRTNSTSWIHNALQDAYVRCYLSFIY